MGGRRGRHGKKGESNHEFCCIQEFLHSKPSIIQLPYSADTPLKCFAGASILCLLFVDYSGSPTFYGCLALNKYIQQQQQARQPAMRRDRRIDQSRHAVQIATAPDRPSQPQTAEQHAYPATSAAAAAAAAAYTRCSSVVSTNQYGAAPALAEAAASHNKWAKCQVTSSRSNSSIGIFRYNQPHHALAMQLQGVRCLP